MNTFMVVARFRSDTDMAQVRSVVEAEWEQVRVLKSEGRLGALHISMARGTIFLEIFAPDERRRSDREDPADVAVVGS